LFLTNCVLLKEELCTWYTSQSIIGVWNMWFLQWYYDYSICLGGDVT